MLGGRVDEIRDDRYRGRLRFLRQPEHGAVDEPDLAHRAVQIDGFTQRGGERIGALRTVGFAEQTEKLGQQGRGGLVGGNDEVGVVGAAQNADPEERVGGHDVFVGVGAGVVLTGP